MAAGRGTMVTMTTPARRDDALPETYLATLAELKSAVVLAQAKARRVVTTELVTLYWQIGRTIVERQDEDGWGAKVIDRLSRDLRAAFPDMKGLSRSNLEYMRRLALAWPDAFPPQAVGEIPWGHVRTLLDKVVGSSQREWYAAQTVANGWSRAVLAHQIATEAHLRLGVAPSNFADRLPSPESDLAQEMVKDPYVFEFLTASAAVAERELEDQLVEHLRATLTELGRGFAFVGRQVPFNVAGDDFYIDLLFFNYVQNRFLVVELKVGKFRPEHTGQLNMYVQWVDQQLRQPQHADTVGLVLCADRNDEVVKLSLAGTSAPMAVADWKALPSARHEALPEVDAVIEAVEESAPIQLTLTEWFAGPQQPD